MYKPFNAFPAFPPFFAAAVLWISLSPNAWAAAASDQTPSANAQTTSANAPSSPSLNPAPGLFAVALTSPTLQSLPEFNQIVLEILREYPTNGAHDYWWPRGTESAYSGSTQDLMFQGSRVMKGEPNKRTYCCGLTLEVFLRSYKKWLAARGGEMNAAIRQEDWPRFQQLWFVLELNGPGPSAALKAFQLGHPIPLAQAIPGDFIQIWRTPKSNKKPSGHSVIFLDWVRDAKGLAAGIRYWSTQPRTKGIHDAVEFFGPEGGIAPEHTYPGRATPKAKPVESETKR